MGTFGKALVMAAPAALVLQLGGIPAALADDDSGQSGKRKLRAELRSVDENPPVITSADGRFRARILRDRIDFTLVYDNIESPIRQAHVHVENPGNNGPITVFLCSNLGNAPAGVTDRPCPPVPGKVEGSIVASDVLLAGNVPAGDLAAVAQVLRGGAAYINIHSDEYPSGEIRGQVNPRER